MSSKFLQSMNLARWILVVGGLGSLALAANGWRLYQARSELETALATGGDVEQTSNHIQFLGKQVTKLESDLSREGLGGQDEPTLYFRNIAVDNRVQMGQIEVTPQNPQTVYKGTIDLQFTIKPQTDRGYMRDRIANFMWLIESQSRRVRVTHIQMSPEARTEASEYANDMWKWSIEATSRSKDEKAK